MTALEKMLEERGVPSIAGKSREQIAAEGLCCIQTEFGRLLPEAEKVEFEAIFEKTDALASKATRRNVRITVTLGERSASFPVSLMIPNGGGKYPTVVLANFSPAVPDPYLPSEELCDMGVAMASFYYNDVAPDDDDFTGDFSRLFGIDRTEPDAPSKIMLWARACSYIADYLETTDWADMKNLAVSGHSRLGKTALLAGALDSRFAFVYSNDSGCSGAAVYRGKVGEDIQKITDRFPYWFCPSFAEYSGRDCELPHDRHQHMAMIAPRNVYVASAEKDLWADPASELLCCVAASPAWELYGKKGICVSEMPEAPAHFHDGSVGYHVRKGSHYLSREDWRLFIAYMNRHKNK